jgi:hypothetical protein
MPPKTTVPMACWLAAPAPPGDQEGDPPQDKGEGSHLDETEAPARGFHRGVDNGHAFPLQVPGKLDDQDGVLAGEGDHRHRADLGVEVGGECGGLFPGAPLTLTLSY